MPSFPEDLEDEREFEIFNTATRKDEPEDNEPVKRQLGFSDEGTAAR